MWNSTSEEWVKFLVSYPRAAFFLPSDERREIYGEGWFTLCTTSHLLTQPYVSTDTNTHTLTAMKTILQTLSGNWKQIKSHNKPFCAQSQAKKERKKSQRNSCSGKIDARRKIFRWKPLFPSHSVSRFSALSFCERESEFSMTKWKVWKPNFWGLKSEESRLKLWRY